MAGGRRCTPIKTTRNRNSQTKGLSEKAAFLFFSKKTPKTSIIWLQIIIFMPVLIVKCKQNGRKVSS